MSFCRLDDYSVLCIFSYLKHQDLGVVAQVCKRWNAISSDDLLWKGIFSRTFKLDYNKITFPPGSISWKREYQRLYWTSPTNSESSKNVEILTGHFDEVNHVAFSADGEFFATCGKDVQIIVWKATEIPCRKVYNDYLTDFHWQSAQFCEFNNAGNLLLVSGILLGDKRGRIPGEIIIFSLKDKLRICSRISNRPYDTVGCWYGNKYVISSEFKWLSSQMISATMLWMNKVSFALEENFDNYMLAGMRTLFKLYGKSGNAPRQFIVANCCKDLTGQEPTGGIEGLREKLDAEIARAMIAKEHFAIVETEMERLGEEDVPSLPDHVNSAFIRTTRYERYDLDCNDWNENKTGFTFDQDYHETRRLAYQLGEGDNDWIYEDEEDWAEEEDEDGNPAGWEYWDESSQKSQPEFLKIDEGWEVINETDKFLIYATGTKTWVPHQVGIKRMSRVRFLPNLDFSKSIEERVAERKRKKEEAEMRKRAEEGSQQLPEVAAVATDWSDYPSVSHLFDSTDNLIEMHGRITGMSLSPCHRYLHINVQPWPANYVIITASQPPPMGSSTNCHILDLSKMTFVGQRVHKQISFVPAGEASCTFFRRPTVTKHLIGDVDGDNEDEASIWDRHFGIKIASMRHADSVTSVALRPRLEDIAVTVSKDNSIKVWRSRENVARFKSMKE